MPFEINQEKKFDHPAEKVYEFVLKAISGLEGQISKQDAASNSVGAKFYKKILGKVLGDRSYLSVKVTPDGEGSSSVSLEAYPLDPVGRKLMFGARKGVTATVVSWFFAHLDHHLGIKA